MNKKILLSLLIIGIIVSVASAGTWAYFSDEKTTASNTLTTGTLKINQEITSEIIFDNAGMILPGHSYTDHLVVRNAGNVPGKLYAKITPDSSALNDNLDFTVDSSVIDESALTDSYTYVDTIGGGYGSTLTFKCTLDPATTNALQTSTTHFTVDFILIQDEEGLEPSDLTDSTGGSGNNGNNGNHNGQHK